MAQRSLPLTAADNAVLGRFTTVLDKASWFTPLPRTVPVGTTTKDLLTVPAKDAQSMLRDVVRLVADLPTGTTPVVVWQQGAAELELDTASVKIRCEEGLVTLAVTVSCDQLQAPTVVEVPLAVGTADGPTGLVMSTVNRLQAPPVVTSAWSDAITAFAWEALLELTRRICAALGKDRAGRGLVPAGIAATRGSLLIQPMARADRA
jgi:hypothetical protein